MQKVAYLCCAATHSRSPNRRPDAYEHDISVQCIKSSLEELDRELIEVDWRDPIEDWLDFEAVLIGTTWDYTDHKSSFLRTLDNINRRTVLLNPPSVIRWNLSKQYLRDLAAANVPTIPTVWTEEVTRSRLAKILEEFRTSKLILKPVVGASAEGQYLIAQDQLDDCVEVQTTGLMLVQPFLKSIQEVGEVSLVFAGHSFSHALLKRPRAGDYRVQSLYGGTEESYTPSKEQMRVAVRALGVVRGPLLYARVDLVRLDDGAWAVIELELIEPYLYPKFGERFRQNFSSAYAQLVQAAHAVVSMNTVRHSANAELFGSLKRQARAAYPVPE